MGAQCLAKKSSNQCYLLLSYKLLCSFPWLVVLEYIFWGAFTSPATPQFGLKIPEVTNLFITFNCKHNSYVRANQVSKKRTILNIHTYRHIYIYTLHHTYILYTHIYICIYYIYLYNINESYMNSHIPRSFMVWNQHS